MSINMDQAWPCYFILTIFMVLVGYGAGDIQCKYSCQNRTCNFMKIQDTCYYVFTDEMRNWYGSRQLCVDQGLSMVIITQEMIEQEQKYDFSGLFKEIPNQFRDGANTPAWLGGRAIDIYAWTFLNNVEAKNYGNNIHSCGFMYNHEINVGECSKTQPFICRFNQTGIQRIDTPKTWFEARSHCVKLGGDLFYLYRNETLYSFQNDPRLKDLRESYHIGLRHRVWEWTDGSEIIFTNWATDGPNGFNKNCLQLNGLSGKWSSNYCSEDVLTFCQEDATSNSSQDSHQADYSFKDFNYSKSEVLVIILGSLLGFFFIITISLVIFNICTKCSCKSSNEDKEVIDNNYYVNLSEPGIRLVTTENVGCRGPSSVDSRAEYYNGASTAQKTNGESEFTNNKPMTKPKQIIGPKTGDLYSTVDKLKRTTIRLDGAELYVNTV